MEEGGCVTARQVGVAVFAEEGGSSFGPACLGSRLASGALAYDLGRHWRLGGRLVFYTGVPKSNDVRGASAPPPEAHPARDPAFYRIDARLEKRWQLAKKAWISLVVEGLNVTLSKETFGSSQIGPVTIPSIGVEAGF